MAVGIRIPGLTSPAAEFTPKGGYGVGTPTARNTQVPQDTQTSFDFEGLADKLWDMQPPTAGAATPDTDPYIAINPSTKKVYVNGFEFDENDASSALESKNYLNQPGKPANAAQGWRRVSPRYYQEYIASIEDPNLGTTFSKNLAVGAGSYTQNLGEFILLASGGKYGAGMVASGMRTQERLSPFVKRFTQVKNPEDVVELFVGSVAQMAPNAAESIITAIAGGIAGGALGSAAAPGAGTVAGAVGGAAAATVAKASLSTAIRKQFAGEILNASERKLLYQASGAYLGSTIAGYPQAVGDIRSEQRQMGVQDEAGAAQAALTGGVPYALLNSVPEFAAGWSLLSKAAAKGGLISRGAKGFAIGGALEGSTEVAQEAINVGSAEAFGAQYTDTEKTLRWIDSFAGGALVGGALGGGINMLRPREKPTDLTVSTEPVEPVEPAEPLGIGYEPRLMLGYEPIEVRRAAEDEVITPPLYPRQPAPVTRPVPSPDYTVNTTVEPLSPLFEGAPQRQRDTFVNRPVTALEPTARPVPAPSYTVNESVQPLYGVSPETLDIPVSPAQPPIATVGPAGPEVEPADYAAPAAPAAPAPAAPAPAAAPAAAVYTPKPLSGKKTLIAFKWLSNNLSPEVATNLSTSNNVLLAPNDLNIEGLQDVTPSIITVSFRPSGRRVNPIKVAYAEDTYGSPQNFAKAMGFDPAALTTYTRWSKDPTGKITTTDAQAVSAYKKPAQRSLRKNKSAAAAGAAAPTAPPITKEEVPRAFQKPKTKKVDVRKQTGTGEGVRTDDTARDEAARKSEAETGQAEENPVGETALTVVDFPKTKKDDNGRYTVTLSDGSTAKVYFDRSGTLGTGWYSDERSKFAPSQPEYVTDYLGTSREEATENLPGVLAGLRAEKEKPAAKTKTKDYSGMSNEDLLAEVTAMDPKGKLTVEGSNQILLLKELYIRLRKETDDTEANKISDALLELGDLPAAVPLLERAVKLADAEAEAETDPTSRASLAPRSLKKNKVKEQTVRGVVDRILSKISPEARKGTEVQYAASMEDLKANNPKLYRLLEKSREKQGDIGTVTPAAFYLRRGDGTATIVMFTDSIVDETHATLVFLEEMVSHHGFRSLLGNEVNPLMEKIYDENPEIAAAAEAYAKENKGVSKAEATEEVIAKELAREIGVELGILSPSAQPSYVPVGILTRLINEIKKLLSKVLGKQTVAFMDSEDVRVLFAKSKQFARTGTKDPLKSHPNFTGTYRGFAQEPRTAAPVVYHGSPNRIEGSLRPSSSAGLFGPGVYLTSDKERARGYAGITGEVVELTVSGKLATRDQWKAATKAASEDVKPSPNSQTEIDNKAIADLEAQGFVGVQVSDTVTVWKAENLQSAVVSRFSVASPKDGPKAAERLTNEERAVLGNTLAADVYERASNGESNAKIAEDLELTSEIVKQIYAVARSKLQTAGVKPRARSTSPKKTTKKEQAILALGTRKADGTYPSVAEVAKQIDAAEATVTTAINEERQRLADEGKEIPAFLLPPEVQGVSRVFEYAQTTTPLYNPQRPVPRDIADALDWLNDRKVNVAQLGRDVLNALKTMNFASRSNAGYREGYRILTAMKNKVAQLRAKYTAMLEDMLMNTDDDVRKEVSAMLQFTTKAKLTGLTDRELSKIRKQYGPLFNVVGNKIVVNPKAFKELSRRGRFTLEEFQRGATREQDAPLIDKDGTPTTRKEKLTFKAMPNLTKDSPSWKLYERVRDTMDQAALDRVEADYAAAFGARENAFRTIEYASNKQLTQADKDFVLRIDQRYRELAKEGAKADNTGRLVHKVDSLEGASEMIAAFNRVLIAEKKDDIYKERLQKFAENFPEKEREEIKKQIESFRDGMTFAESNKYDVQRVVANVAALELGREGTELYAMRSIAGGYIPIGRTGRWQTRIRAVDPKTGQVYGLMESFRTQLPYFQHEDRAAAESLAKDINKLFPEDKATMEVPVFDTKTKQYVVKQVRLEAVADAAREASSVDPAMNINDFQRMITRFGITLTPQERERVIIGMTEQDARARQGLERQNTEGADPDSVPYISQHLVSLANITGRRTYQHQMDGLMDEKDPASQRLWNGDPVLLKAMGKRLEEMRKNPGITEAAFKQAERAYNQLAFEMRRTEEEGGKAPFIDRFVRDLAFLEDQKALEYADFASDGLGQEVRTWTAVSQLGGLISSAALNVMALPLNVLPGLASYNPKTNFGGGFGMAKSATAILAAIKDVGGTDRYRAEYYEDLLKNKEALANSGLTRDEAEYLAIEIKSGNLQASLANALLASAKGRFGRNPKVQKFIDAYMSAFTYVEQAVSRAAALAAYRLEKERLLSAGIDPDNSQKMAGQFGIDLKNNTVGNYDMYNRPGAFRGGLRDFVFMYKMYPLMVIQLLSVLSPSGKAAMLLPLLLFSGMKGFPGAEDFMDILDTIMQKLLKLPAGSSEKWLTEQLNEIAPGLGPVAMRGAIDQIVPATVSSRVGMGNLIPGTSMFISGSNQFNELLDFLGPAASFVEGSVSTATNMAQLGLSTVGLSGGSAPSVTSILRDSPVSLMRAIGDTIEYAQVGAIVDSKGYVASYDLNAGTYISRLLGFYPSAATRENDIVRVNKREADYLREVSTEFRRSYVKAALRDDREGMQRVIQKVREWNEASEGTGLEINNFAINARRAVQEARKTSSERYATSAPKSLRKDIEEAQEASGVQ